MKTLPLITTAQFRDLNRLKENANFYSFNTVEFLIAKIEAKGVRIEGIPRSCREIFVTDFADKIRSKESIKKAYICVYMRSQKLSRELHEKGVITALNCIRLLEKTAGWRSESKLYCLRNDGFVSPDTAFFYLFEGSCKWIRSPHMLSLYCLLIRAFYERPGRYLKVKTVEELLRKAKNDPQEDYNDDCERLRSNMRIYLNLMKNFDKIFKGFTRSRNFSKTVLDDENGEYEGIDALVEEYDSSCDPELKAHFHAMLNL